MPMTTVGQHMLTSLDSVEDRVKSNLARGKPMTFSLEEVAAITTGYTTLLVALLLKTGEVHLKEDALDPIIASLYKVESDWVPSEKRFTVRAAARDRWRLPNDHTEE